MVKKIEGILPGEVKVVILLSESGDYPNLDVRLEGPNGEMGSLYLEIEYRDGKPFPVLRAWTDIDPDGNAALKMDLWGPNTPVEMFKRVMEG